MEEPITLLDPETVFEEFESLFVFKKQIQNQNSPEAIKLKRFCAFLFFYAGQAEEKFRVFDVLRPDLSTAIAMEAHSLRMTISWWAYLDVIVHVSNLFDKPTGSNEPASVFTLSTKLPMWGGKLGVTNIPSLQILGTDSRLQSLLNLRDKIVVHVEPKSYFEVLSDLAEQDDFFGYLINDIIIQYLEGVFGVFFQEPPQFRKDDGLVQKLEQLFNTLD
ncbi:MAG TPA: hypothetical protein VMT30_04075 [Candidatus Saccharimonadia bacterium]|nr:hypothetical protein [Candidatus Saccharimonadia bacterium]